MTRQPVEVLQGYFRFEDPSFAAYLGTHNGPTRQPIEYLTLAENMADHPNPLVRYTAGWAAAEAAQFRLRKSQWSSTPIGLEGRMEALEFAGQQWMSACGDLLKQANEIADPARQAEYYGFGLRALNALSNLPMYNLVSRLHAHEELEEADIEERLGQTRLAQLENAIRAKDAAGLTHEQAKSRAGLNNEVATQQLLQDKRVATRHLFVPASIRIDNHPDAARRADLIAHGLEGAHRTFPIQVSKNEKDWRFQADMFTVTDDDILLPRTGSSYATLRALYDRQVGNPLASQTISNLGGMSMRLGQRFNDHVAALRQSFNDTTVRQQQ